MAEEPTDYDSNPAHHSYELIDDAFEDVIDCPWILIDHINVPNDCCKEIAASIQQGTARAVSDGSYYDQYKIGASAFVISAFPCNEGKTDNTT